jgi:hypothetical protein
MNAVTMMRERLLFRLPLTEEGQEGFATVKLVCDLPPPCQGEVDKSTPTAVSCDGPDRPCEAHRSSF